MSSTQQGIKRGLGAAKPTSSSIKKRSRNSMESASNDLGRGKVKKVDKSTRRTWSLKEEAILLASLKELLAQGWKSDNGFRAGYLNKLEDAMRKEFPGTDLKGIPHINSKLSTWKKNYYSLTAMLSRSGVGFNVNGTHMIDCNTEQWEQIVKSDANAKAMRYKSWPMLEDWKEIFGKDRATGDNAEDIMDAVNDLLQEDNREQGEIDGDYHVNLDQIYENEEGENSVCQSEKEEVVTKHAGKKRKVVDNVEGVVELLRQISRNTDARLDNIASRIGYEFDLGKAKKDVFEILGDISGLSLSDKFDVCEILADKTERLEIFMGLPNSARPQYVERLLKSKLI